jgi:hypothetical protein
MPTHLAKQYRERAQAERDAGGSCTIDRGLPSISIKMSSGEEFYYQEHEADRIIEEAKKDVRGMHNKVSIEDYLLAVYQNA